MADIELPQLGETVTEGTITQWFKAVGDQVEIDEPLFEVSTDKVDSEIPSTATGVVSEILVAEGETVDVGTKLAVISDGAAAPATKARPAVKPASPPPSDPKPAPNATPAPEPTPPKPAPRSEPAPTPPVAPAASAPLAPKSGGPAVASSPLLSPVVRRLVNEHGLDPAKISGTGPGGRITRNDVLKAAEGATGPTASPEKSPKTAPAPAAAPSNRPAPKPVQVVAGENDTVEPFNNIRRRTAEHMVMSKQVSPHVLMASEVDYERVEEVRRSHGAEFRATEGFGLNYLPFICLALVDAIREYPKVNASVGDGALIVHRNVNLGVAVDLDHEGLIVPVVHAADDKRLRAMARSIHEIAERARSGGLSADDITGGTFTVSNPGPFGTYFTGAIINQPQVAILSTEGVNRRPVVVEAVDGTEAIAIHSTGLMAFSFDHRAFDGAYAAAFLRQLQENIETRDWAAELS